MPDIRLYDSFPALIRVLQQGRTGEDHPLCIYYFQENFDMDGMARTVNAGYLEPDKVPALIDRLCRATLEGRAFWKPTNIAVGTRFNQQRFQNMLTIARTMNPDIPVWNGADYSDFTDAYYNRSVMRRFLNGYVTFANRL